MIWRDDRERAAACNAILRSTGIGDCFDAVTGSVTDLGIRLRPPTVRLPRMMPRLARNDFASLSDSARVMIRFAWDVWNGSGDCPAIGLLEVDVVNRRIIARYFAAWASSEHHLMARFIFDPIGEAAPVVLPRFENEKRHALEDCPCRESSRQPRPNAKTPNEFGCVYPCPKCNNTALWKDGVYLGCIDCRTS